MANETLITDLVAQEAMQQLEELDRAMEGTLQQFQNCARELAQGLKIPVEVTGDVDALRTLTNTVMRDAQQATQQLTQQLQQQQQVVANTTNTISRQLQAQENLNKAQREAFVQDQEAQRLANALLGTRQQNYELMAKYKGEMKEYNDAIKKVNEQEKNGLITQEQAIQKRATLMASYDKTKIAAQELQRILNAQNKEANAVEGSYAQLSQRLELLRKAYKQMTDAEKASVGGQEIEKAIQNLDARLKDLDADMGQHQRNVGNYAIAAQNMKGTLRELTEEIAQLTLQYNEMSDSEQRSDVGIQLRDKITQLTEQAGKYRDVVNDVKQSIKESASDTRTFDTLIESGKLLASTFGLCSSAAKALGISEDSLQKAMLKVQAAMQAVQALTVIQNTLQKQSNLMKGVAIIQAKAAAAAANIEAAATASATGATKAQTIAQAAFNAVAKANPYVLLATAIIAVVGLIIGYTAATKDATEATEDSANEISGQTKVMGANSVAAQTNLALKERLKKSEKEWSDAVSSNASSQISNYTKLQLKWQECNTDQKTREKFQRDYGEEVNRVAGKVLKLSEYENFFVRDTKNVVDAILARAAAEAGAEQYAKAIVAKAENDRNGSRANGRYRYTATAGSKIDSSDGRYSDVWNAKESGALGKDDYNFVYYQTGSYITLTESGVKKMNKLWLDNAKAIKAADDAEIEYWRNFSVNAQKTAAEAEKKAGMGTGKYDAPKAFSGGGGGGSSKGSRGGSSKGGGGGGGSSTDKSKSMQDLVDADNKYTTDALNSQKLMLEEYSDAWYVKQVQILHAQAANEKAANKKRYDQLLADLEASKEAKKISDKQYEDEKVKLENAYKDINEGIDEKYTQNKKALDDDVQKHKEELAKEELKELQKKHEQEISKLNIQNAEYLEKLHQRYLGELKEAEGNEEEIARIKKDYADDVARAQLQHAILVANVTIDQLEKLLQCEDLTATEREEIEQRLAKTKVDLSKAVNDEMERNIENQVETEKKTWDQRLKDWIDHNQKYIDVATEGIGRVSELMTSIYDGQISKVQELIEDEQKRYEAEVNHIEWLADRGAITTEEAEIRKRDAAEATAKKQEALEKKKSALEYKKAIVEKANSVAQAIIATALAVTEALPNIPLSILVGALGAAQVATILAQPIKAYAEGTKGHPHPGGLAVVGDANRAELVMYGKRAWITPDSPTLVDLPKGAEVMPDASKVDLVQMGSSLFMTLPKRKGGGGPIIVNDYEALEGRVANNTKAVTQTLNRFERNVTRQMRRQNFRNYINART